tara:strand:+ start:148 stop:1293 length:1146 start_codon:yes stop_codon:yes gene_type:complete
MALGTWRVDSQENRELQIKSGVDKTKLLGNTKKTAGKRKLPHPKQLSYPVAITPDESNGSRLLIKCFEYISPGIGLEAGYTPKKNTSGKTGFKNGYEIKPNEYMKNKEGYTKLFPTNLKLKNEGASDVIGKSGTKSLYYVELPIPQDVNDSNTVTWGDDTMNVFQLAGLQAAAGFLSDTNQTFEDVKAALSAAATDGMGLSDELKEAVTAGIAGRAIDPQGQNINTNSAIGRATGQVLNSNLELLFNSVNLRSFPMNVVFSPRSPEESMRVKHIIRAFKSSMAAKKGVNDSGGQGSVFLRAPDVFQLRYLHNGKDHPFLNSFKHCALTGMAVNYTNAGTFASYSDGTPVSIQMSLTFKELNPIYQEDYDDLNSGDSYGVGF